MQYAGQGSDRVLASATYALGASVEELFTASAAGTTALSLTGNEIAQTIVGNAGGNIVNGKGGSDVLRGLGGNDFFVFDTALGAGNVDLLADFSAPADQINLDNAVFAGLAAGGLTAAAFHVGAAAADALDRIIYDNATGQLYFDADGVGGAAQVQFASVGAGAGVTKADFFVV